MNKLHKKISKNEINLKPNKNRIINNPTKNTFSTTDRINIITVPQYNICYIRMNKYLSINLTKFHLTNSTSNKNLKQFNPNKNNIIKKSFSETNTFHKSLTRESSFSKCFHHNRNKKININSQMIQKEIYATN